MKLQTVSAKFFDQKMGNRLAISDPFKEKLLSNAQHQPGKEPSHFQPNNFIETQETKHQIQIRILHTEKNKKLNFKLQTGLRQIPPHMKKKGDKRLAFKLQTVLRHSSHRKIKRKLTTNPLHTKTKQKAAKRLATQLETVLR